MLLASASEPAVRPVRMSGYLAIIVPYTSEVFTGIITQTAVVRSHASSDDGLVLTFSRPSDWADLVLGESIATNGACLTVAQLRQNEYDCHLMSETLAKTTFGSIIPSAVNLERSLSVADRFGGHFVQGHVDTVGEVVQIDRTHGWEMAVEYGSDFSKLVVLKGSICIDGVSLTVARAKGNQLTVALIPHTLEHTTLGHLTVGDKVNLEFDMLGKYIVNLMEVRDNAKS